MLLKGEGDPHGLLLRTWVPTEPVSSRLASACPRAGCGLSGVRGAGGTAFVTSPLHYGQLLLKIYI